MDRLSHLRGEAGGSRDSTLDTTSPPSEAFMTANESSSKYFSLSEVESTFDISSIKDVSLASTNTDSEGTITNTDELISNLSPIGKKSDILDSYKIGKQIEAANILSGGVDIFDDNDNSYDGDELVIDDNVEMDEKSNLELKQPESIEYKSDENITESTLINEEADIASKDTEVVLQIDGKNVDAIDIGNGLYLYRKEGQEELAAVQIIDDDQQQPSFKFLKVRENAEGNLEVYEEIEIEVPKEVPAKEIKSADKKISHVPIKDINKVISDSASNKVAERKNKTPRKEPISKTDQMESEINKETSPDSKSEVNLNGKMMKFSDSRKSPVIGSFTPMTYHSTPNKEGIPLTKTMVDQQLHPNRHSDNVKKTIEVHTDSCKQQKPIETPIKYKDDNKAYEIACTEKEIVIDELNDKNIEAEEANQVTNDVKNSGNVNATQLEVSKPDEEILVDKCLPKISNVPVEQDNATESIDKDSNKVILKEDIQTENVNIKKVESILLDDSENKVKKDENIDIVAEATDTLSDKGKANNEEPVHVDSENQASEAIEMIEVSGDESKAADPIQLESNKKSESTANDNTHGDSQGETKTNHNINPDPENDDVIIMNDGEIEESTANVNIVTNNEKISKEDEQDSSNNKEYKIAEIIGNNNNQRDKKDGAKIDSKSEDQPKIENEDKRDVKMKISPADLTSFPIPESQKELTINQIPLLPKNIKNSQSKIPHLSNKVMTKPTAKATAETSESKVIPTCDVLNKTSSKLSKKPENSQQAMIAQSTSQEDSQTVPEKLAVSSPAQITDTKTIKQNKLINVLEDSFKTDPIKSIQAIECQPTVDPVKKDSDSTVKEEISKKDKVVNVKEVSSLVEKHKHISHNKSQTTLDLKPDGGVQKVEQETNMLPAEITTGKVKSLTNVEINKAPIVDLAVPSVSFKQDAVASTSAEGNSSLGEDNRDANMSDETKPNNNNKKEVPFGKWTATNRKEFLDKIRARVPATTSTSNQLKTSNDLNRRDVLKKIDSQRQSSSALSKAEEANKLTTKNETVFSNKATIINKDNNTQESKIPLKTETVEAPSNAVANKIAVKSDITNIVLNDTSQAATATNIAKKESSQRTEVNYQDLIDKTIEGMIHRTAPPPKSSQDEPNQNSAIDASVTTIDKHPQNYKPTDQATLDAIEMKMNELHGIPFIERPPHELPQIPITEMKSYSKHEKEKQSAPVKTTKIPNLLPFTNKNQQKIIKESIIEVDSEDEVIEHEPITGDIVLNKKNLAVKLPPKEKTLSHTNTDKSSADAAKKESIITEKDFDKFARRNSITYENCITVKFDGIEQHNLIKTLVEKDPCPKSYSRNDIARFDPKAKLPFKYQNVRPNTQPAKAQALCKFGPTPEDSSNRNQSKLQKAYHSALTAKRQMECPITIIEDKPVKVVFMDNMEFIPSQLNVQGQELSPTKKPIIESDNVTVSTCDSLDSDALDTIDETKTQEEIKTKTKHQRKQVLTPVDEPELELIEPKDLGLEMSPKKKRKTDEDKTDRSKYPMRKKYYLLGSNAATEEKLYTADLIKNPLKETANLNDNGVSHKNTASAIDNLVKAAELLEHQSENMNMSGSPIPDSQQSTPVKRGRGRPRKYPLPEGGIDKNKVPSPQKKPRLIDAKPPKRDTTTDEDDSDDEIIKENWTMGKINENIVCPICNKLFRTENVVFKHVKHCTGPSPSRSDSDKRSSRRSRQSQESDSKSQGSRSDDMDLDDDKPLVIRKETPKKRKSKDSVTKFDDKDDVIIIEDTPVKEKSEKREKDVDDRKHHESRKPRAKVLNKNNDLVCEFCGKTFRQLSYLVSHKLQHKKDEPKKIEKDVPGTNKAVYSCEVCKKEFRKLHHLVQHRIIHNPISVPARSLRKSSSEHADNKIEKEPNASKQTEDPSAGFRCEPCDKSFRKLHHLVEHRETHDGINRQKTTTVGHNNVEKPVSLHECEVCKKTFRKLHHLIEHKEQHVETSSEKSDDKTSVKSSLSTKDIIHECSLCYMVFPNEHSLNKHTVICQRKKRQSKQSKPSHESDAIELVEEPSEASKVEEKLEVIDSSKPVFEEVKDKDVETVIEKIEFSKEATAVARQSEKHQEIAKGIEKENVKENTPIKIEAKPVPPQIIPAKRDFVEIGSTKIEEKPEIPDKLKKVEVKGTTIRETPKKKTPLKEKSAGSASKRLKTTVPTPVAANVKREVESSDDEEVRYMLNPNFKVEDTTEEKVFMKVRAKKRSSLQIERPNSKDLVKRRTSLQHPPKIPRLKPRPVETMVAVKSVAKTPKLEPVLSTDSDDSETVKYSFPKTIPEKPTKPAQEHTPKIKDGDKKIQKKTLTDKRKSLSGIAKRKSLGKAAVTRHKPTPMKQIKRRTLEVEHRCDCGQLFSSAALLSRHTTLAHTPPRIRRRRSPPPDDKPVIKPAPRKSSVADKPKQIPASRKSSARSDSSTSTNTKLNKSQAKPTRKSLEKETKTPIDTKKPKPEKSETKSSVKPRKTVAHRGVPVPEKMRKLMQKNNK